MRAHVKRLEKELVPIDCEQEFFNMYDALVTHKSVFLELRKQLLAAWKRGGELYTLEIVETNELYGNPEFSRELAIFAYPYRNPEAAGAVTTLPVFCWRDDGDACIMLFTAPHVRKLGLAKELVEKLGIARVYEPLEESESFWHHLGITQFVDKLFVNKLPKSGESL
jgi:GNAT superfamily N-acetyltransferase